MNGGGGADTFVFAFGDSSAASGQHDRINGFIAGVDRIDLSGIDAIAATGAHDLFRFIGTSAFSGAAGELNYFYNSSLGVTVVQGDTNGDRVADFAIDLAGNVALSSADLIGLSLSTVIESQGSTSLTAVGSSYFLYNSSGQGPSLKNSGVAIVAGQYGAWAPIGVEATATGYQVVWKAAGTDHYSIWSTNANGNQTGSSGIVSGSSNALTSLEASFNQDLNGDGMFGTPATLIESQGSTSISLVGESYFLYNSSGQGPSLKNSGVTVVASQYGAWTPIGAEATATGYQVVWKAAGTDYYSIWSTDANGNQTGSSGIVSGSSSALISLEASFNQDLNGDGAIGAPVAAIESQGSTSLIVVGNSYFLHNSSGQGPSLKNSGVAIVAGQYGAWAPIGVEATATGYQVVWKAAGTDYYSIWSTNSNGNQTGSSGIVSGSSNALTSLEASFNQDLNGDGTISSAAPQAPSATAAHNTIADAFLFRAATDPIWNAGSGNESFHFAASDKQSTTGPNHTQATPLLQLLHSAEDGLLHHQDLSVANVDLADLFTGRFIIH